MRRLVPSLVGLLLVPLAAGAAGLPDIQPDPKSVQRYGPAYRYPQAGWIVLHVEGKPYERGYQHGRLLAPEIAAHVRCFATVQSPKAPSEGWKQTRTLVNALFVRRYAPEYLEEMRGIADGASAAGARFDNRPIDLVDVVALNAWPEIDTLDSALEATATGLEGKHFSHPQPRAKPRPKPMHCSAFAATGPATADGKIVFGHITMFALYPSLFYNVWIDVKPAKGHRVLMQSYPAGIQSGLDYYMNDAGLLVCETTIAQTKFDVQGQTIASRIRYALQYADSIDKAVAILAKANNGLYTNEWLLADTKTNEIAMFELGTHKSRLYRSSKNEWFGGTEGFYWGCNNTKDLEVRLETVASVKGRPANVVFRPSDRDKVWQRLYREHRGKIDANFGKLAFTTPPLAAYHSLDAKFTTTDLAKDLKTWALFGPPLGRTWQPTHEERQKYPEVRPLVSNPWTVLHAAPPRIEEHPTLVADLHDRVPTRENQEERARKDRPLLPAPAWHGTLLPQTDADVWLAAAFADYQGYFSREKALVKRAAKKELPQDDRDGLAVSRYAARSTYLAAARILGDVPLSRTRSDITRDEWYRVASGKGFWLLHELRRELGDEAFVKALDTFGRDNAGKRVATAQFRDHVARVTGKDLGPFFERWLGPNPLPRLRLESARAEPVRGQGQEVCGYCVSGAILCQGALPRKVAVTVETTQGDVTETVLLDKPATPFRINVRTKDGPANGLKGAKAGQPRRVVVDRYGDLARANGGTFTVLSFLAGLEHTLIVYGTGDEVAVNREAAEALQRAIVRRGPNFTVPIKADRDVTEEDLKGNHLLLIGRPDCNRVVERFRAGLPVDFGSRSFTVRGQSYAHARSAVIAAADNPLNRHYSLVVLAGLSAEATLRAAPIWVAREQRPGEVLLLAHGKTGRALVVPDRALICEVKRR